MTLPGRPPPTLDARECWALLRSTSIGRLAYSDQGPTGDPSGHLHRPRQPGR
jgi:hypothetical protein